MNYLLAILAGAVQGLTEFLPVSSTGHLIIFENIFGISQKDFGLAFDASLHLGTLMAILLFFYKDYLQIFKDKLYLKLAVGTIPAALGGAIFEKSIESSFRGLHVVGTTLVIFSIVMILAEKISKQNKNASSLNLRQSTLVGLFQALALIPGISRSGSTISAGLFLGLTRGQSARFAFMLSGPIVAGAGAKKFLEVATGGNVGSHDFGFFVIGIISSSIFGYLTIKYFLKYLSSKNLYPFIVYRVLLGLILIVTNK